MGAADDGRLELDDLGSVIDHASSLASSTADDLLEGNDAPTWAERLEAHGVTPWFRRHRMALGMGAVAVVALAAAGTAWTRMQPPPVDPTIRADVADALSSGLVDQVSGVTYDGVTSVAVQVKPIAGEAITILGITGPGIRASTVVPDRAAKATGVDDVFLAAGCDDPRSSSPTFDDYRLRVIRTDSYGRDTTGTLVLPSPLAAQLADTTVQNCFQTRIAEVVNLTSIDIHPDVSRRTIGVTVTMHNAFDQDLLVQGVSSASTVLDSFADPANLTAGVDTTQQVLLTLDDCTPQQEGVTSPAYPGGPAGPPTDINFFVTPLGGGSSSAGIPVAWSPAQRARIGAAIRAMCAGGPGASARVLSAAPAPVAVSQAYGFAGPNDGVVLRLQVELGSRGSRVALSDGSFPYGDRGDGPRGVTRAAADTHGGRAVVTVDWAAQCSSTMGPPDIWLTATAGGRPFPYRGRLDQLVLAHAYSAACPGTIPADLSGFGWPTG